MDDLVTRVPPVADTSVQRLDPETSDRNPDRQRHPRKKGQAEEAEEQPEDQKPATTGDRKMDFLV